MRNIILFLMFFIFASCEKQGENVLTLPEETIISGMDYSYELIINYPWSIDIIDGKLLLFMHKGDKILKIVDADKGVEINSVGTFGDAPEEFVQPEYWGIDRNKNLLLYDIRKKHLKKYSWNDLQMASEFPKLDGISLENTQVDVLSGKILDDNYFVGASIVGLEKPLVIFDEKLGMIENIGNIPDKEHQNEALVSYGGTISTSKNKFVFVMASLGYVVCYEQQKDGMAKMLWEQYLERPIYKGNQLDLKQLKLGFSDVKMTENYIFCSYFGQKYVRENRKNIKVRNILVFDHQGNLLKNLRTNRSAGRITVSEDEKTIYAITEEPEVAVIRFDISDIMK